MNLALIIIHIAISVILIATVLMQHGKQQGLSGAIAGGAETFFGKNKGRTVDAILKKITAVVAILFIISSLVLTAVSVKDYNATEEDTAAIETPVEENAEAPAEEGAEAPAEEGAEAPAEEDAEATAE